MANSSTPQEGNLYAFEKEGKGGFGRERIGAREEGEFRASRVFLAPKTFFPFPFKRLPRRLPLKQFTALTDGV